MDKNIKLQTHDGSKNYLEEIEGKPNQYNLVCAVDSLRGGRLPNGEEFIDPSGGPMIVVGRELACYGKTIYIVKDITIKDGKIIITLDK